MLNMDFESDRDHQKEEDITQEVFLAGNINDIENEMKLLREEFKSMKEAIKKKDATVSMNNSVQNRMQSDITEFFTAYQRVKIGSLLALCLIVTGLLTLTVFLSSQKLQLSDL